PRLAHPRPDLPTLARRLARSLRVSPRPARNLRRKAALRRHLLQSRQLAVPGRYPRTRQARYPPSQRTAHQEHLDLSARAQLPFASLPLIALQCSPSSSSYPLPFKLVCNRQVSGWRTYWRFLLPTPGLVDSPSMNDRSEQVVPKRDRDTKVPGLTWKVMLLMAMGAGRHQSCQSTRSTVMNGIVQDAVP